jgi:Transport protein Trs120 or TRAPPC9, TRAPP II complex subunit
LKEPTKVRNNIRFILIVCNLYLDFVSASTKCVVAPGSTSRFVNDKLSSQFNLKCSRIVLPLRKLLLSNEQASKPIPTLSERQFVVDKLNLSSTEEKARRELFWYREELFKCVRGRWQEVNFRVVHMM